MSSENEADKLLRIEANKQKSKKFTDLLKDIDELDEKLRALYIEIYSNAIADRTNAEVLLEILIGISQINSTEHAVHGKTMAAYIERMAKSNAQLLQLAQLINEAQKQADDFNPDDLFAQIKSKHNQQ